MVETRASSDPFEGFRAALGDRYEFLGDERRGGMAVVLRARDRRHGREVAIKVLHPELAAAVGEARFSREIETAARLQHVHILPVYDSGTAGGRLYYVMPFVQGESLADRLGREGALPVPEAVRLAREVASALAHAHASGVIHRDIKPENILLLNGHAVVADFGIARAVQTGDGASALTATGMAVGTAHYMSPEQALGAATIDGRSDIYSLACVLYESLVGERPFRGASLQSVIAQSIAAPRPHARSRRKDVPRALDHALARAMAREPEDRFPTADAFATALDAALADAAGARRPGWRPLVAAVALLAIAGGAWWTLGRSGATSTVVRDANVIAVLPFSVSGQGVDYLGEGLVDLVATNLTQVGGLEIVPPRLAVQKWKERRDPEGATPAVAAAVGKSLGASAVLVGSAIAVGSRVRLTADLLTTNGGALARAQADGPIDSVMALVDSLSVRVVREIWRAQRPVPELRVGALTTHSLQAMRAYLDGEREFRRSEWKRATDAFSRAIELDSSFTLAYLRLSITYGWMESYGSADARRVLDLGARGLDRLPPRERALFVAHQLFARGSIAALDSARGYVAKYQDDIDAWLLLGEVLYHGRQLLGPTPAEIREPFDRVLALDSSLAPALSHPLELSLAASDSAFARYVRLLRIAASPADLAAYTTAGEAARDDGARLRDAVKSLITDRPGIAAALIARALATGGAPVEAVLGGLAAAQPPARADAGKWAQLAATRARLLVGLGRLGAARTLIDSLGAEPSAANASLFAMLGPVLAGMPDTALGRRAAAVVAKIPGHNAYIDLVRAHLGAAAGDADSAQRVVTGALRRDTSEVAASVRPLFTAAGGWAAMVRGDTTRGLTDLDAGLRDAGFGIPALLTAPMRYRWADALARKGDTPAARERGTRALENGFDIDYEYFGLSLLSASRAFAAANATADAERTRAHLARLWERADPAVRALQSFGR
jgi:eukaryotic-like serine/threonine-protein kinase